MTAGPPSFPQVQLGPIQLADATRAEVLECLRTPPASPFLAFAVHIGAVELFDDQAYVDAMAQADLVYADGVGIVALARLIGSARRIERAPTTDLGFELLRRDQGGVRVALIGGPAGLAEAAGRELERFHGGISVVYTADGYRPFNAEDFSELRSTAPDVVYVGMGMPREALWASAHRAQLPPSLVVTCGGWFGFVSGRERRAPAVVQHLGMEWTWRLAQRPRLLGRYLRGAIYACRALARSLIDRLRNRGEKAT